MIAIEGALFVHIYIYIYIESVLAEEEASFPVAATEHFRIGFLFCLHHNYTTV
jgi:hypothetical protein